MTINPISIVHRRCKVSCIWCIYPKLSNILKFILFALANYFVSYRDLLRPSFECGKQFYRKKYWWFQIRYQSILSDFLLSILERWEHLLHVQGSLAINWVFLPIFILIFAEYISFVVCAIHSLLFFIQHLRGVFEDLEQCIVCRLWC